MATPKMKNIWFFSKKWKNHYNHCYAGGVLTTTSNNGRQEGIERFAQIFGH